MLIIITIHNPIIKHSQAMANQWLKAYITEKP